MNLIPNKVLRKYLKVEALIVFQIAVVSFLLIWGIALNPTDEEQKIWFQRMGALMTIFSFYIEVLVYRYVQMWDSSSNEQKERLRQGVQTAIKTLDLPVQFTIGINHKESIVLSKWLAHVCMIAGTVIWAYGDLIYDAFI